MKRRLSSCAAANHNVAPVAAGRVRLLRLRSNFVRSRDRLQRRTVMPVKAGVVRAAARTTRRGAAETFTGVVFQDPVLTAEAPSRMGGSVVTFTPGARTA